ncbi:G protein-coupled glucose receptor regulating Gpa2-domain-containing protein [Xylaria castorea]|nr:G protein-coupled glucose receptor regulating Gpa2-domain-containing protein [Xylaria castorea]
MAPFQHLTAAGATGFMSTTYDGFIMKRDSTQDNNPTDSQMLAVMCVSLIFATISVGFALFAFYWFVRMRRGFRQDMIMLLIQSDMAKTLWLLISPLFYFITGKPFGSNWAFCQVSGFFLTVTVEASDIAVLLIAIHTALFVLKRQYPGVALGLEPYRRIAYTLWAVVPFLLAAIVPITGASFVDNGPHCYLPIQPGWYPNALAWVPRYIILSFIIVTYTWLYLYVYIRFRRFEEDQRRASTLSSQSADSSNRRRAKRRWKSHSIPKTPSLATHHLLDDSPQANASKNEEVKLRQHSVASTVSTLHIGEGVCLPASPAPVMARRPSIAWNLVDFGHDGSITPENFTTHIETVPTSPTTQAVTPPLDDIGEINSNSNTADTNTTTVQAPKPTHAANGGDPSSHNLHTTRRNRWKRRFTEIGPHSDATRSRNSLANMVAALRQGPPRRTDEGAVGEGVPSSSSSSSPVHLSNEVSESLMRDSRDRMRRQLRLLFVYPAIYTLTWIAPFVAHVCRYYDAYPLLLDKTGSDPNAQVSGMTTASRYHLEPQALRIVSAASLCIGAAVDCGFFSAWERPWRHLGGGFWENLALRLRVHRLCGGGGGLGRSGENGPGRNRDERVADERAARTRRAREEMAAAAAAATAGGSSGGSTAAGGGGEGGIPSAGRRSQVGRRREWWDVLDEAGL